MDLVPSPSILDLALATYDSPQLNLKMKAHSAKAPVGLFDLYVIVHK